MKDPLANEWNSVHEMMNTEELSHLFGVRRSSLVNRTEYQVAYITTYRPNPSSSSSSSATKSDSDEGDEIRFEFTAFGR